IQFSLPEMPWAREERFTVQYGLSREDAVFLAESAALADFFEGCVGGGASPLRASNWVRTEVLRVMNEQGLPVGEFPVAPSSLGELVAMVDRGKLSTTVAREVFGLMAGGKTLADSLTAAGASSGGLSEEAVAQMAQKVLQANPDVVDEILSGRDTKGKKTKFLLGLVMKESRGQAAADAAARILEKLLNDRR
ncbi:MAG: Asp-tRNA(Asn)/Glu-tRNA(Gln) amidotransferase GatCAB subunit B, partial [Synergistaceae bacterium]|nr:Asp-tRNA(Asn)/Glu-tRNA(Gln) amidotransferase GatCAB subunit B [Synergistaceae bacterium]